MNALYPFAEQINKGISQKQLEFLEYIGNTWSAGVVKNRAVGATRMLLTYALYQGAHDMRVLYVLPHYSMKQYMHQMKNLMHYSGDGYDNIEFTTIRNFTDCCRGRGDISTVIFDEFNPNDSIYVDATTCIKCWTHQYQTIIVTSVQNTQNMKLSPSVFFFQR